jgi:hypothetical protein
MKPQFIVTTSTPISSLSLEKPILSMTVESKTSQVKHQEHVCNFNNEGISSPGICSPRPNN